MMNSKVALLPRNSLVRVGIITAAILMIPLVAMQFSQEAQWGAFDFVAMGVVLFVMGTAFELLIRKFPKHKVLVGIGVLLLTLYIWAEMAVGIFTNIGS